MFFCFPLQGFTRFAADIEALGRSDMLVAAGPQPPPGGMFDQHPPDGRRAVRADFGTGEFAHQIS